MNFFEHQDRARRSSRRLVLLFIAAVLAIVVTVNLVAGLAFDLLASPGQYAGTFVLISLLTLAMIAGASAYRVSSLRSGGGTVAQAMGGTLVTPDTSDPQLRRLRNVVEEVALASGVPTPQIYVMEQEQGINAFAAGYSPADAAVAVTRGTLDTLTRDERQGVIAHEFSHILNGDVRLNIRLMGVLFGILALSLIGRLMLHSGGRARGSRSSGGVAILGLGIMLIGYIGVLFGRLIKAGVSRQREFLADASAVQFTRQPQGIAGALKKIGALSAGSRLQATDTEEVSHMLFANGLRLSGLLATHPPLVARIRALEPDFRPEQFAEIRRSLERRRAAETVTEREQRAPPGQLPGLGELPGIPGVVLTGAVLADLEQPDPERLRQTTDLIETIPRPLYDAAHEIEGAVPVVLALLLGTDPEIKSQRLEHLGGKVSATARTRVEVLAPAAEQLQPQQRLPLLALTLPALRQRSPESLQALLPLVDELIHLDGRVTVFEYALGRLLVSQLGDILEPRRVRADGRRKLIDCRAELADLYAVLARHGQEDETVARRAYVAGMSGLFPGDAPDYRPPEDWVGALDAALERIDGLEPLIKQAVVQGLVATVTHDDRVTVAEAELLRAICACLHVPVPPTLSG